MRIPWINKGKGREEKGEKGPFAAAGKRLFWRAFADAWDHNLEKEWNLQKKPEKM